ncbi:MAG TPA: glycerophosphodiester phosphodiesterase family protein [Pseudolabrys sp.]|nr:glycerophosphodiester phosphodiesterase family protein [Pseudolabrys sp.]
MSLDWLTARPIAHRGLHDAATGAIENTPSAMCAAIAAGYGMEVDLQISADGEAMLHHDDELGRLTDGTGVLAQMTAAAIKVVPYKDSSDHIITLGELCDLVGGRATLLIELKSHLDGDLRLVKRAAEVLASYTGPVAVMSFDPVQIEALRAMAPRITRGITAERWYDDHEWDPLTPSQKRSMAYFLHAPRTRPQFVAYGVRDLPAVVPLIARSLFGCRLLTWTVRTADDRRTAARYADQIIFEGFRP